MFCSCTLHLVRLSEWIEGRGHFIKSTGLSPVERKERLDPGVSTPETEIRTSLRSLVSLCSKCRPKLIDCGTHGRVQSFDYRDPSGIIKAGEPRDDFSAIRIAHFRTINRVMRRSGLRDESLRMQHLELVTHRGLAGLDVLKNSLRREVYFWMLMEQEQNLQRVCSTDFLP